MITDTRKSPYAKVFSVPYTDVEWTGGLYKERFDTCADVTVGHLQHKFENKEICHVAENFRIAAGEAQESVDGIALGDGDFYNWMESAVYTAVRTDNQELLDKLEEYIAQLGRSQKEDVNDFEVCSMGHMFTSACLYYRLTGHDSFLKVAKRAAGYLERIYREAAQSGEVKTAVCPSHYMGLIELYRTTGDRKYLELAKLALQLRDSVKDGLDDNQSGTPLKEHRRIVGHAAHANYLYAGVADLYMEEGDPDYLAVLESVWKNLTTQKIYITGGCGALYSGAYPCGNFFHNQLVRQAYGYEYQLPNVTAYNETCASIGGVLWAWRMFCIDRKVQYMDMLERMMLNVNLAGISLDGKRFSCENMLRRAKNLPYELVWGQERTEYILNYCCPSNLARTIAETSEYAYAADDNGVWTGLYGESRARFHLKNGAEFTLIQHTDYPWDGKIVFEIEEGNGIPFTLHMRVPFWCKGGMLVCPDDSWKLTKKDSGSYVEMKIRFKRCRLTLTLRMAPRLTMGHGLVEETRGQVAVECGPLVYCVETPDVDADSLEDLVVPTVPNFSQEDYMIAGRKVKALRTRLLRIDHHSFERDALYQDFEAARLEPVDVRMIPYFAWDNRGRGEMMIWMPVAWR